ncbi:MAG: Holliday junction resolvase RuvX [Mycoplasmataceae bacterium]|nr:Holliday junction resolvase RuvX [Mycoplasmataceae bacterium]
MRLLGIDLGTKKIGLAITDIEQKFTFPLKTLENKDIEFKSSINEIGKIIFKYKNEIGKIILGFPTKMDGSETKWTKKVKEFKQNLYKVVKLPIILQDERMTTINANTFLKEEMFFSCALTKKKKDEASAAIIIDEYLKKKRKREKKN